MSVSQQEKILGHTNPSLHPSTFSTLLLFHLGESPSPLRSTPKYHFLNPHLILLTTVLNAIHNLSSNSYFNLACLSCLATSMVPTLILVGYFYILDTCHNAHQRAKSQHSYTSEQ